MFVFSIVQAVKKAMKIHTESPPGHILLFLTGQDEIERCCDQLFDEAENLDYRYDVCSRHVNAVLVLPLYGSMPTGNETFLVHMLLAGFATLRNLQGRFSL